jgi:hypothetical protein
MGRLPKGGNSDYASVNPHNFQAVLMQEQLTSSLQATIYALQYSKQLSL